MIPNSIMSRSTITFLLLLLFNVLFVSKIHGEQKIMGAFGVKFGDYFDPSSAIGSGELKGKTPIYQFNPEKKFRSFDRYFVMITPKTHKIYSIWGVGRTRDGNYDKCKKEYALIMELLQKRYGSKEKEAFSNSIFLTNSVNQGNRHVLVQCGYGTDISIKSGHGHDAHLQVGYPIEIRYYDQKMKKLVEKERIEIEKERIEIECSKIDDSGL
ncbi:MAG: hypothetical protein ACYSWS_11725 [Planctomycetota bacterium]|jgi:hypothetical protein